jgi:hypothetical protein
MEYEQALDIDQFRKGFTEFGNMNKFNFIHKRVSSNHHSLYQDIENNEDITYPESSHEIYLEVVMKIEDN